MVTLNLIDEHDFDEYFKQAIISYAKEKATSSNLTEEEAFEHATTEFNLLLPMGEKTEHHYIFSILHENEKVGVIWLGQASPLRRKEGYIYDFVIFEQFQGRGFGKEAMQEIDEKAKELDMNRLELHVFGHNKIARLLYEKNGYEITNIIMAKTI